jgi:hypothetical protein
MATTDLTRVGNAVGPNERRRCACGEIVPEHPSGPNDRSHGTHASERHQRRHALWTRRFARLPGLGPCRPAHPPGWQCSSGTQEIKGTWDVTARFPRSPVPSPVPIRATRRTSRFRVCTSTSRTERYCSSAVVSSAAQAWDRGSATAATSSWPASSSSMTGVGRELRGNCFRA